MCMHDRGRSWCPRRWARLHAIRALEAALVDRLAAHRDILVEPQPAARGVHGAADPGALRVVAVEVGALAAQVGHVAVVAAEAAAGAAPACTRAGVLSQVAYIRGLTCG